MKVTIVGAGVIGISSAYVLANDVPDCQITIVADSFTPTTTSDVAGGLWGPFAVGDTPQNLIDKWSAVTWNEMVKWSEKSDAKDWGITLVPGAMVSNKPMPIPSWNKIPIDFKELTPQECQQYGPNFTNGQAFTAFTAEPSKFLPKLTSLLESKGIKFVQKRLKNLEEVFDDADLVVNCTGIGARFLVPDDQVVPCRGQVVRVEAPWVKTFLSDENTDSFAYILPNTESIVLGGTFDKGNWSREEDPAVTATILARCKKLMPSLEKAMVIGVSVGLRPFRETGVRLEKETVTFKDKSIHVIHNYGHGGSGVTLMFGCAQEVADIIKSTIK